MLCWQSWQSNYKNTQFLALHVCTSQYLGNLEWCQKNIRTKNTDKQQTNKKIFPRQKLALFVSIKIRGKNTKAINRDWIIHLSNCTIIGQQIQMNVINNCPGGR